jgi:hypothetical protein
LARLNGCAKLINGRRVVDGVGEDAAPKAPDTAAFTLVVCGLLGLIGPGEGAYILAAQELDVPEFPGRGGDNAGKAGGGGQRERLMQRGCTFVVAAPRRVYQRSPQRGQGMGLQRRILDCPCLDVGATQAVQTGVEHARRDGRLAGLQLGPRRCPPGDRPGSW